ncbi:cytochrome C553 [Bacillus glycinifermentans]|uniref:SDR family oxidoreductase n=1 Tax=Bacillus glycinifermentans TaxID=1664069 RepID=UPI000652F6D9|nr:SDR family NAD(P)-dependent oxidoreductase [Bacillus glycinifermentans]ATH94575.1 SDR family oxidoreductase [Bacillus glycinifermentans]KMM63243.1 cytochrome C553 [Bacillus glycinifermentans]MEC0493996.1 SDR family NAD(P)-dependent oxidoreductase [Bacillus glycinifermentans]MEC0542223.1 SDR family NAD(P)-dependent oxidoreductase [Bacillus glycinifermentans]MEC3608733.1 SDR family NAD(P)-dependent oxidoreductase [Bacillus glycinifermentans]
MELSGNTILITGGASGIGLAFAERFVRAGNTVIICGRREKKLEEAKQKYPDIITRVCDVTVEADRIALFEWVTEHHPQINVLVNNAGIQQRYDILKTDAKDNWAHYSKEIAVNLEAPLHLAMLFAPYFAGKKTNTAIINVTSGLAFTPMAIAPIYSSTKAALHSFTMSLRHQLSETAVQVIEVAPPAVNTDLGGVGLHDFGAPVDDFADAIFKGLKEGRLEIGYGRAEEARRMSRDEIDESVAQMYSAQKSSIE